MGGEDWPSLDVGSNQTSRGIPIPEGLDSGLKKGWDLLNLEEIFLWETSITALTMLGMGQMQKKWLESTENFPWAIVGNRWGHISQYLFLFATPIYWQSLETSQVSFLCSSFISILLKINSLALATSASALSFPATRIAWQNEVSAN